MKFAVMSTLASAGPRAVMCDPLSGKQGLTLGISSRASGSRPSAARARAGLVTATCVAGRVRSKGWGGSHCQNGETRNWSARFTARRAGWLRRSAGCGPDARVQRLCARRRPAPMRSMRARRRRGGAARSLGAHRLVDLEPRIARDPGACRSRPRQPRAARPPDPPAGARRRPPPGTRRARARACSTSSGRWGIVVTTTPPRAAMRPRLSEHTPGPGSPYT